MNKIRYAMIGFGGIAENRIAKEGFGCDAARFNGIEHGVLVGATDMNPARRAATEALGLKWYESMDDILADASIDAVYIATNNASHAALALKAMDAGKHAIIEKPIATTIADAQAMIAKAAEKNLSLTVDHMMVNNTYNVLAKQLVADGAVGEVNDSCFHMEFAYGYDPAEAATWRCSKIEEMGGPVGDVASHCAYVAEFIFDSKVTAVNAVYLPKIMDIKAEDGAYVKFTMANGQQGSFKVAFSEKRGGLVGTLSNLGFEIYGSAGVLRSFGTMFQVSGYPDEPYHIRLELETADGVKDCKPANIVNIYQALIDNHAVSVQTGKHINAEDGCHNLAICAAIHASAQQGGATVTL